MLLNRPAPTVPIMNNGLQLFAMAITLEAWFESEVLHPAYLGKFGSGGIAAEVARTMVGRM